MSDELMHTGGGTFDPTEENVYFIAANTERLEHAFRTNHHLLVAVNELAGPDSLAFFLRAIQNPEKRIFLDSGVFNLAMTYARKHEVSHDVGLSMAPEEIDGFSDLFDQYVDLVRTHGDHLWGYIEIDQGGRENKIRTRARLEALGLRPIPVYHPLNDGWDYFDYLAQRYDRICFGNIVKADRATRIRLIATAWERHRKYPHVWIHLLGLTPNEWLNAFPVNSGDSSSWMAPIRWTRFTVYCDGASAGEMERGYRYILGGDAQALDGSQQATALSAYQARMGMLSWRAHMQALSDLGITKYPEPTREVTCASSSQR